MEKKSVNSPVLATGRRKNAIARVKIYHPGKGRLQVNRRSLDDYFGGLGRHKEEVIQPLKVTSQAGKYDIQIQVSGGGVTGQAEAIRHGIARALLKFNPEWRKILRKEGLLTRDSRIVERKKAGQPKARKRFQFSKR